MTSIVVTPHLTHYATTKSLHHYHLPSYRPHHERADASRVTPDHAFNFPFWCNAPSAEHQHNLDEALYSSAEDHQQPHGFMTRIIRHISRVQE